MQYNQAQNLPHLSRRMISSSVVFTSESIYYLLASNYHNHLLLWILLQQTGFQIVSLNFRETSSENSGAWRTSMNQVLKPVASFFFLLVHRVRCSCLLSKMPWPTILFCPQSIFCCCCLIHPVPEGTNAWKCLHFSLVSWKSWPIDKKNTSATIIWHLQSVWSYWLFEFIFLNPSHMFIFYSVTFLLLNKSWQLQCLLTLLHCYCHEATI